MGSCSLRQFTNTVLANAYVDLGNWSGSRPISAAASASRDDRCRRRLFETANGQPYAADLTPIGAYPPIWVDRLRQADAPQPAIAFAPQNWNRTINSTTVGFAWALMAGFSYQLTPERARSTSATAISTAAQHDARQSARRERRSEQSNVSQQVRIGVRYLIQ